MLVRSGAGLSVESALESRHIVRFWILCVLSCIVSLLLLLELNSVVMHVLRLGVSDHGRKHRCVLGCVSL